MLWKSQTQVSHSLCLQGACTERKERRKSSNVYNAREKKKKQNIKRRLVTEKMTSVRGSEYELQGGDQAMNWASKNG